MSEQPPEDDEESKPDWIDDPDFWRRFWAKVVPKKNDNGEICLVWKGALLSKEIDTYGVIDVSKYYDDHDQKRLLAHRVRIIDAQGPIPKTKEVHHSCGNKACIRLDHLEILTPSEHRSAHAEQYALPGEDNPNADLTADEVKFLRRCWHLTDTTLKQIAEILDIFYTHASEILRRHNWDHLEVEIPEREIDFRKYDKHPPDDIRYLFEQVYKEGREVADVAAELQMDPTYASEILQRRIRTDVEIGFDPAEYPGNLAGERNGNSKLTEGDIGTILRRYWVFGETQTEIAEDYPVNSKQISAICRRADWTHVEVPDDVRPHMPDELLDVE